MKLVGYCRVSTNEQAEDGQSLATQRAVLERHAAERGDELVAVIEDPGESGKSLDRPGLQRALRMLADREVDGLVVVKLDRLTRSVRDVADLAEWFDRHSYALRALDLGMDTSTAAGKLALHVLAAASQFVRESISENTRAVLQERKRNGLPVGGPATSAEARAEIERLYAEGVGLNEIARRLTASGISTSRGGQWRASTVQSVLGFRSKPRPKRPDLPKPKPGARRRERITR
jgi:site-specific DNA recombinase